MSRLADIATEIVEGIDGNTRVLPPTEIYNEGWLLRFALVAAARGIDCLPFHLHRGSRWFSEGRLHSPFVPQRRKDELAEGLTRADATVGHFDLHECAFRPIAITWIGSSRSPGSVHRDHADRHRDHRDRT
ncbi:MAG TPA: hypothetical protein VGQ83_07935 [Polyangia bacterium]